MRSRRLGALLNAEVPATDVAERAGHSLAVLLSVYAKCMDGERRTYNARISAVPGE
jgi:hypothetical protein